jgi:hypothetical protein
MHSRTKKLLLIITLVLLVLLSWMKYGQETGRNPVSVQEQVPITETEITAVDESALVETYLREHIATLAPDEAVLGGTWYVIKLTIDVDKKTGIVTYEDGHIQGSAQFSYVINNDEVVITSITAL